MDPDVKDLFRYVNNIYTKQFVPEESEVPAILWKINRFLSMDKDLLELVAYLSRYMSVLGAKYYALLMCIVPQSFVPRNKYVRPDRESDDELLERYVKYLQLSKREVRDALRILLSMHSKKEVYEFVGLEVV